MERPDSVRKAWFADSQFFSVPGLQVLAALRDRVHHTRADLANSVAARIRPALRVRDFRRVREWAVA
jgi:hypothetical protein